MNEFLSNLDWYFLLQVLIFILALRTFTYLVKVFKRFEYSGAGQRTVLNETSNFVERQIVNETLLFYITILFFGILLFLGSVSIILSIIKGFDEFLKLPALQNSWVTMLSLIGVFACLLIAIPWLLNQFRDSKTLTDYEKLEKYLKLRKSLNVTLQFRFANLQKAFLPKANLSGVDFAGANFSCADLRVANFSYAKLMNADMGAVDLREANLRDANLENAKLTLAFLSRSTLINANLQNADLTEADLAGVDLTNADLRNAKLVKVNLTGANLTGANLKGANLDKSIMADVKGFSLEKNDVNNS